ncbi:hypothetical protein BDN70DRAFT_821991 [Pholiota conissans]|uniref:Uncharacterized protein n=1 Tax=Pholiota conissans TaxID=109636 RepID=A0A9P6D833_9AGAR|nr:hypothetical protein BDN70DRAFT_821991 [Pholiota conissans]
MPPDAPYSRRHSMPLSPDDVSFLSPGLDAFPRPPPARISSLVFPRPESPTSFIDLSDDEYAAANLAKGNAPAGPGAPVLRSKISIDTLASDDLAEEERRRKRERLAKLHRFLGSRVPAHLVLGTADPADLASLPLPQASSEEDSTGSRKTWLKRRRSSSAVILPSFRLDELERVKEELDDKEKAINVRRAHKMEKVFGVAPPQTLYHTRHCPTPRPLSSGEPTASSNSATGASTPSSFLGALPIIPASQSRTAAANNATNRTAYLPKVRTKTKKGGRPGTAESSKQLLPKDDVADGPATANANLTPVDPRHSFVYSHYQHSLNSLNDILDRDDRASLVELHEYLNSTDIPTPTLANPMLLPRPDSSSRPSDYLDDLDGTPTSNVDTLAGALERRLSLASLKSERRRSLPARTSMISLASSEISVALAGVDAMDFQQRRKRAAKLTQFFGVNYRELITDVLDSIENGVAHEGARGTLKAEEVEDLLTKLRTLKTKRTSLFS